MRNGPRMTECEAFCTGSGADTTRGWAGGDGTRPGWLALLACGIRTATGIRLPGWESRMQLLPMASSPDGLISAWYAVITKTPGWEVLRCSGGGGGGGV